MLTVNILPSGSQLAFSVYGYLLSPHANQHHEHISIRLVWNAQTLMWGMKEAFRQCKVWLQPIKNRLKWVCFFKKNFTSRKVMVVRLCPTEMGRLIMHNSCVVHQQDLISLVQTLFPASIKCTIHYNARYECVCTDILIFYSYNNEHVNTVEVIVAHVTRKLEHKYGSRKTHQRLLWQQQKRKRF